MFLCKEARSLRLGVLYTSSFDLFGRADVLRNSARIQWSAVECWWMWMCVVKARFICKFGQCTSSSASASPLAPPCLALAALTSESLASQRKLLRGLSTFHLIC